MKNLILATLFLISCAVSYGQSDSVKVEKFTHEVGLNVTSFISQFVSLNSNIIPEGQYLFTYKNNLNSNKGNKFFRLGAGIAFSALKNDEDG